MNIKVKFLALLILLVSTLTGCANGLSLFATATPTVAPTPTNDPQSSAKIVKAFWDALAAGDLETAMTYVDDDIVCAGACHFKGKVVFRSYLQGYLDGGYVTKIGDLKSIGSIVTFSWEVSRNGLFVRRGEEDEIMQVENGKIVYWENYHSSH
jgi:hypothetical protein